MRPRGFRGKGDGRVSPLFSLSYLEPIEGSVLLCMTRRARMAISLCMGQLEWPTRWIDEGRDEDVDLFIQECQMALIPVEGCVSSLDIAEILIAISQIEENMSISVINNNCGCCGGSGGGSSDLPNQTSSIPQYAPTPSSLPIGADECKKVTFTIDQIGIKISSMSGFSFSLALGLGGIIALLVSVIAPAVGFVVSVELASLLWQLVASVGLSGEFMGSMSSTYAASKQELICLLMNDPLFSASSQRAKFREWIYSSFVDGSPEWLFFYAMSVGYDWDGIYSGLDWQDTIGMCDACSETSADLPAGYEFIQASVLYESVNDYPLGNFWHDELGSSILYRVSLQANGAFFFPFYTLESISAVATNRIVGLLVLCGQSTRNAYPIEKHSIRGLAVDDGNDALLGQIESGKGFAILAGGEANVVADLTPYLNGINIRVVDNPGLIMDDASMLSDDTFNGRDKVNSGGTGGLLSVELTFIWIRKLP